jgi:hypothetical protein
MMHVTRVTWPGLSVMEFMVTKHSSNHHRQRVNIEKLTILVPGLKRDQGKSY